VSITISTDVFCDGDGCIHWVDGATGPRTKARAAREHARRHHGWTISRLGDFCPDCAKGLLSLPSTVTP
jgi:hypothetical protein